VIGMGDHWNSGECRLAFSEHPTGGV